MILHVVNSFAVGGLENGIVNLINRLPADRWRHGVIALTTVSESFCRRVVRDDVEYIALNKPPGHLIPLYPRIASLLRKLRPNIVHTRNLGALEALVPAWAVGVPGRIHGEHGWDVNDPGGGRRRYQLIRRAYRPFVSQYVALSEELERYLRTRVGVPAQSIARIYNGVDCRRFQPAANVRMPIIGSPFNSSELWLVGTVGRLQGIKDQATLVRGFARALALDRDARATMRLVLAGDGPERGKLESIIEEANLGDVVWVAGERQDIPEVLRGFDLFVLPSLAEGISNTILEAMACALPVIATAVGGNAELIQHGITGSLVPAARIDTLAHTILDYFHDRSRGRREGTAARVRAQAKFDLDGMIGRYDAMYESTALRRSRRSAPTPHGSS